MRLDSAGIISQIHRHALERPESVAARHQNRTMSYRELDDRSFTLSQDMRARGVEPGSVVAICVRPGFDILVAIAAIFRCQAVYMPLDPDHPAAHVQRILLEAAPVLILTHRILDLKGLPQFGSFLFLDEQPPPKRAAAEPLSPGNRGQEPAYLMYTSGTTGLPKGVLIANDNLDHYLSSAQQIFQFSPADIFCNVARYTFSISLFDLLLPLAVGASVRLIDRQDIFDFAKFSGYLEQATTLHAGPSLLGTFFRYRQGRPLPNLRHVSTGGDLVLPIIMEGMKQHFPQAELYIMYGTTEISCMGTVFPIPRDHKMSVLAVGRPFPGVSVEILPEDHTDVGEICFAGAGVGLGYLKNTALTDEKFPTLAGARQYRTGDFGRRLPDGTIEMIGRRDFQIQLRGVRMELSAIENCILERGLATQCAVVVRRQQAEDSGYLAAFLVGPVQPDPRFLTAQLSLYLPSEMVPGRIVILDAMPVTFNGKLDRRTLMDMPIDQVAVPQDMSELEEAIATVISENMGIPSIGLTQNFFEMGGHSLLAIVILSELNQQLKLQIMPHIFFQNPTVQGLAAYCRSEQGTSTVCNLVPLNESTAGPTMFFLSGVQVYRSLALSMAQHRHVIGMISLKELGSEWTDLNSALTMTELARDFVEAIQRHQKEGPYELLGYSFAGILAVEVARQLREAGHEVSRLVLIDALLPEWIFRFRYRLRQIRRIFRTHPLELLRYVQRKLQQRERNMEDPRYQSLEKARGHRNRILAEDCLRKMTPYDGDALLFVAAERLRNKPLHSRSCGWAPYIGRLKVIDIEADHFKMIEDPQCLRKIAHAIEVFQKN